MAKALSELQTKMLSFAERNKGWHSVAHSDIITARSLLKRELIELKEYPKKGKYKPTAQFRLKATKPLAQ